MKKSSLLILLIISLINITLAQIPYNQRYITSVFDEINITTNVVYGNAPAINYPYLDENNTSPQDLLMDIYQPVGDTLESRPAMVCVHSGAFISGSKEAEDMVAFCDSMAHRGYVSASIDYRMGMNIFSSSSSTRAVYRGIQDGRAAIRYLKENAVLYGIDTNNIYLLGSSAGAYIGQHNYYMDTEEERPQETYLSPDLGCLDCTGNDYEHSGKANGLVALWGALMDTNMIISTDTLPVFLAHGTADETVPFGYGSAFGNSNFPATYGSSLVAQQLEDFGNDALTYFVPGAGHEFYGTSNGNWTGTPNQYWDTVFNKVESYYYDVHKPIAGFYIVQMENAAMFYDTSKFATNWYWDFGDGHFSTEQNPEHIFEQPGEFVVVQFVKNELDSWDTVSAYAYSFVGVEKTHTLDILIYPNPASNYIVFQNNDIQDLNLKLMSNSGRVIVDFELQKLEKFILPTDSYPKGLYFVSINNGKTILLEKIIIN